MNAIDVPVFVANGDTDPMILPCYAYPRQRQPARRGRQTGLLTHGGL